MDMQVETASEPAGPRQTWAAKKVLVIEDEPVLLDNLLQVLALEDITAIGAADGVTGIEQACLHAPDLILCDIAMAGLSGYEVIVRLRENPQTAQIPVVFMTARAEKEAIQHGLDLGANDYITKPFTIDRLFEAIGTNLS